jgi:hypothetical protein
MSAEFGARLTIAHITAGVELWGPGGSYVNSEWKAALVGDASDHIAELQRDLGIDANVYIGSGDVPQGAAPSCGADKGGLAGYRLPTLRRLPAHPRVRDYFRDADSSCERVRADSAALS